MTALLPTLKLRVLGSPALLTSQGEVPLATSRHMHLLAYLAVQGTWQRRDQLARLFWPERPDSAARSNLRNLIHKAQAKAPFAPLESTEHALRLQTGSDLEDFGAAFERGDWPAAVRSGAHELLPGFEHDATEPFLNWLRGERETLLARWTRAVQALLASDALALDEREALARTWAQRCPHDEDAVRAVVAIAIEQGRAFSVPGIVRAFEQELQQRFGVPVSRGLRDIALAAGQSAASVGRGTSTGIPNDASPAPSPVLAGPLTSAKLGGHVGRRAELRELDALLADESLRLLTVTGPGGVGKSTLLAALHVQLAAAGRSEASWVNASTLGDAQEVMRAIAAALGIEGLKGAASEVALAEMLGERRCVLLIDGAEQPDLVAPLGVLLERCPHIRIVLAARRRLNLEPEQIFVLDGFPLPDADELDAQVLAANDGVICFAEGMRGSSAAVDLARDAPLMAGIVREVQGLPLALKLLANLTRLFDLPQLLQTVQLAMAGGGAADLPGLDELMPALSTSFDASWKGLSPLQQQALAGLAVFPASFTLAAARAVTGAEIPVLTALADQSLLSTFGTGRLVLHAAIRACVLARCPPSDELHLAFTSYFARQLGVMSEIANHKSVQPIQKFMAAEWPNIEQAWRSALLRRDDASLVLLAESLMFQQSQLYAHYDIGALFIGTEQQLRGDAQLAPSLRALLLAGTARCLWNKLNQVPALDFARRGLQAAVASRQRAATYCSLGVMFEVYLLQNKLQEVEAIDHRLERTFSGAGEEIYRMRLFILRSMLKRALGDYAAALQLIDKTIAELQRFEWFDVIPLVMLDKCVVFEEAGDEQRSMQALEAAWLASELGSSRQIQVFILANLVNANPAALQNPSGLSYLDRANTIAANCILSSHIRLMLLLANAVFESRQRRLKSAGERFIQLLAAVTRQEALPLNASIFMAVVIWFRAVDDREACVTVLRHVEASADKVSRRSEAQKELAEFGEAPASGDELAPEVPPIAHVKMAEFALPRVREGLKQLAVR